MASQYLIKADEQFKSLISAALHRVPFFELNQPLYHFTDFAGLEGILRTRSLWATLATALEDISEIKYALEIAKKMLKEHESNNNSSLLGETVPLLDPDDSRILDILGMKTYIVSLRITADEKAHWETYGRAGKGFAIAFALKPLVIPGVLLLPVLYDQVAQNKLFHDFVESNLKLYGELLHGCPREKSWALRQRAINYMALGFWILAPILKNPSYCVEKEWRLIVCDLENVQVQYGRGLSKEVKMRRINNRDIPYKVIQYNTLPIVCLELGPNTVVDENNETLKQLLKDATSGFNVPVVRSKVSLG